MCFEYVWMALHMPLMESRFKPGMNHLSFKYLLKNPHWARQGGNTWRVWRAAITFLDLWPCRKPMAFINAATNTHTHSLLPLVKLSFALSAQQAPTLNVLSRSFLLYLPSFLSSLPPSCSLNVWIRAPGRLSHRVVFVKGEKGSSDPGGSGYCGG